MELDKLDLQTNRSHLSNYFAMQYKDFNEDFADYINKVVMNARFNDARINSDDIAFFAPELKDLKKTVFMGGNFLGTVADFTVKKLVARSGNNSKVMGTLKMKGLPDINTTTISFTDGSLQTNSNDLTSIFPELKEVNSPNLAALGTIIYNGSFNGTINNFVTAGSFTTQLGGFRTNISMQLPAKGEPTYTGNLETTRFDLGRFFEEPSLGLVDFNGQIDGSSFKMSKLKTSLEGKISSITYNDYTYQK
jgi:hypothetical protein